MKNKHLTAAELAEMAKNGQAETLIPGEDKYQLAKEKAVGTGMTVANGTYTGFGDPSIDNSGAPVGASFNDINEDRTYIMQFKNTSDSTKEVVLNPGLEYGQNLPGEVIDGAFKGRGDLLSDPNVLVGEGSPGTIAAFKAWMHQNPTLVRAFRIKSNSALQADKRLYVQSQNPFHLTLQTNDILIGSHSDEHVEQQNVITVNKPFILDNQTRVSLQIAPNSEMSITFFIGVSQNTSKLFTKKYFESVFNSSRAGR